MSTQELPAGDWRKTVYGRSHISGVQNRKAPLLAERLRVQEAQGNRCLYCEIPIGATIWRRSRTVTLRVNWDHFVPYAYLARNPRNNWVLACHVCNAIKSCRMFDSVQAARAAILPVRIAKGYEDAKDVLMRLGITPQEDPWPEHIRLRGAHFYHLGRLLRAETYLTACGKEVSVEQMAEIQKHQTQCKACTLRRDSAAPLPRQPGAQVPGGA